MTRTKQKSKDKSRFKLMIFGALGSLVGFFAISLIFSFIASLLGDPLGAIGIMSLAALILTAAASGFIISRLGGDGGFITALLSSLLFSLCLMLTGFIAGGASLPISCIVNYLIYMAISALFAVIASRTASKRHKRHY